MVVLSVVRITDTYIPIRKDRTGHVVHLLRMLLSVFVLTIFGCILKIKERRNLSA